MNARLRRRELLLGAGATAVALGAPSWARGQLPIDPATYPEGGLRPELVTVTERGFEAWWRTEQPADTTIRFARIGEPLRELTLERRADVHVARVTGLRPGTRYRYELSSNGRKLAESKDNPGRLQTLASPGGRVLARVVVMNDLHVGEACSGTATSIGGRSVPPCYSAPRYAARMVAGAVREIRRLEPDLVIANGDLTDRGRPGEVREALAILGRLRVPVLITRGNHDRTLPGAERCGSDGDCLREFAFPRLEVGDNALTSVRRVGGHLTVIGLDSCDPDSGEGRLDLGRQLAFLDRQLSIARRERRRAIVAFHHPITSQAITTSLPPLIFGVDMHQGGRDALEVIAKHSHVALVLHGHTHRNYISYDERNPHGLPFLENGAVKEYPGGYGLLTLREGGLTRTFHRMDAPFCRRWVRTTAQEFYGRQPDYTLGPLSARAFVVSRDGRTRPPATVLGPYESPVAAS